MSGLRDPWGAWDPATGVGLGVATSCMSVGDGAGVAAGAGVGGAVLGGHRMKSKMFALVGLGWERMRAVARSLETPLRVADEDEALVVGEEEGMFFFDG